MTLALIFLMLALIVSNAGDAPGPVNDGDDNPYERYDDWGIE